MRMNKINILQMANSLGIGGTEKCLETFTRFLNKDIFNVCVCGLQGGIREQLLRKDGFDVRIVGDNYESLTRLIREKEIHISHIHRSGQSEPLTMNAVKKANVPVVLETNVFGLYDDSESGKLIDAHLLISKTVGLRYAKKAGISPDRFLRKCRVIYYPVDLGEFKEHGVSDKQISKFKLDIGVERNTPLICRVGRPDLAKWDTFPVDMMACLARKLPEARYLIVGGIPREIKRKIGKLGLKENFIETSFAIKEKLVQIYCSIDVLAHSSKIGESFGYTIAEAMSAGKPVVVNSTPWADNAQVELVDNQKTGFVTKTPRTFAAAVAYLIENRKEAKKMGIAGRQKVEREYEARKTTKILEKIYLELLRKKGVTVRQDLIKEYEDVQYFPSDCDILNYPTEYKKRLNNCFGESYSIEKLKFRSKWAKECLRNLRRNRSRIRQFDKNTKRA